VNDEADGCHNDVSRTTVIVLVNVEMVIMLMDEKFAVLTLVAASYLMLAAFSLDELRVLCGHHFATSVALSFLYGAW